MRRLVSTYGKTWHTWHSELHPQLPVGIPALMMSFTADGQLNPMLVSQRDRNLNVDTKQLVLARENIPVPMVDPLANAWERDGAMQLNLVKVASILVPPPDTDIPTEGTGTESTPDLPSSDTPSPD